MAFYFNIPVGTSRFGCGRLSCDELSILSEFRNDTATWATAYDVVHHSTLYDQRVTLASSCTFHFDDDAGVTATSSSLGFNVPLALSGRRFGTLSSFN